MLDSGNPGIWVY